MQIDKRRLQTIKRTLKHALAAIILVLSFAAPVAAGPFEDAGAALNRGDYATALRLIRPLADQGNANAQVNLGQMYVSGVGVPQDYVRAHMWFTLAAAQGEVHAQYDLGIMYENGQGVSQNYAEALKWYRKAADQGEAHAQYNLGIMYGKGQGVPQDYVRAHMWFNLSAAQGNQEAAKYRDIVAQKMTAPQIAEARKRGCTSPPKFDSQIQNYFCRLADGISCRISDYAELKKQYALGDLVREIEQLLKYDKDKPLIILRALSYVYLYAYFFYELKESEDVLQKGTTFIKVIEKATAPRFFSPRGRKVPENFKEAYDSFKKQVPVLEAAHPLVRFNLERADNYDLHAKIITDNTHQLDYLFSSIGASVPPAIFLLLHYMDTVVVPWNSES